MATFISTTFIQHEVRPGMLLETGYIGNTAQKQIGTVLVNQPRLPSNPLNPEPVTARQPYPGLSSTFSQAANYQWSNYNAWYAKMEQRLSGGLSYIAAYTRSKFLN